MPHGTIDRYLKNKLKPQLATLDVQEALIQHTLDTVRTQMVSCIKHWNDDRFRHALLMVGDEEAGFYKPSASYDIRSFVVVTVRNSALETIHTTTTAPNWRGKSLSSQKMREITTAAIEYFKDKDFTALSNSIGEVDNDIYGNLSSRYPIAWEALSQIGESERQVISYEAVKREAEPNLRSLRSQQANFIYAKTEGDLARATEETSDGYALSISPELRDGIQQRIQDEVPFIADSFKGVSRNIEKLLTIMEYVLWHKIPFITSNYLIYNGYIECRLEMIKPGHSMTEMLKNWSNPKGLAKNHKGWLQAAVKAAGGTK